MNSDNKMIGTKGFAVTALLLVLGDFAQAQEKTEFHQCFVEENSFSVGSSASHSFEIEATGLNARFYYNIRENICFGPEFSYFKTAEAEVLDFDFVAHYVFASPWVGIYPVAGLNYSLETQLNAESTPQSENGFGVVYGLGLHRNMKRFTLFVEYSRINGAFINQFLSLGAIYRFNLKP